MAPLRPSHFCSLLLQPSRLSTLRERVQVAHELLKLLRISCVTRQFVVCSLNRLTRMAPGQRSWTPWILLALRRAQRDSSAIKGCKAALGQGTGKIGFTCSCLFWGEPAIIMNQDYDHLDYVPLQIRRRTQNSPHPSHSSLTATVLKCQWRHWNRFDKPGGFELSVIVIDIRVAVQEVCGTGYSIAAI